MGDPVPFRIHSTLHRERLRRKVPRRRITSRTRPRVQHATHRGPFFDPSTTSAVMEAASGMTITVGPHGEGQTKVKARFSQVYYPRELEECYSLLWQSIDKQGFLDNALDAPVEGGG